MNSSSLDFLHLCTQATKVYGEEELEECNVIYKTIVLLYPIKYIIIIFIIVVIICNVIHDGLFFRQQKVKKKTIFDDDGSKLKEPK